MKRASSYTLIVLLFCACTVFTQADGVLRSLSCPWWKTGSPYAVCDHDRNCRCGSYAVEIAGFPEDAYHESDQRSESPAEDGCCANGCCKSFQPVTFLATGALYSIRPVDFPPVFEKIHSLPCSDYSKALFHPPQV